MIVNQLKLTVDDLKYIVDESPERYNRFIANQEIPIISLEEGIKSTYEDFLKSEDEGSLRS